MVNAQEWLDNNYPTPEAKVNCKTLVIAKDGWRYRSLGISLGIEEKLEGSLSLSGFTNLEKLDCRGHKITSLHLKDCTKLKTLWCSRNELSELNLTGLNQLEQLGCSGNYLRKLDLSALNSDKLSFLRMENNCLTTQDLSVFSRFINLETLLIGNGNKKDDELDKLGRSKNNLNSIGEPVKEGVYPNLYNHFVGSLEPLKNLSKLEILDISNTDINEGIEHLPKNIKEIYYSTESKPCSKIREIKWQLDLLTSKKQEYWKELGFTLEEIRQWINAGAKVDDYEFVNWLRSIKKADPKWVLNHKDEYTELSDRYKHYGLCQKCQQPNIWSDWCQKNCNLSGNQKIDEFIQNSRLANKWGALKWIPYEQFTDIEYLAEGGFSKVYKANWSKRSAWDVVLKKLDNSQNASADFLQELANYELFARGVFQPDNWIAKCNGVSQDPQTGNYVMIMNYIAGGSLRQWLNQGSNKIYDKLEFRNRLSKLCSIANGLDSIHKQGLIHRDLHTGNILNQSDKTCYITDLGLCRPANEINQEKIYGVLPYIAPEVLRGKKYTPSADIYSFGIIVYETFSSLPPYHDLAHDEFLSIKICQGLRPNLDKIQIPQSLKNLISRCWDSDPNKRPKADEIWKILGKWGVEIRDNKYTNFNRQYKEVEQQLNSIASLSYKIHPRAIYTSRSLDFKNLPKPRNSKEVNEIFYKATEEMESLRISNPVQFSTELEKKFDELQEQSQEIFIAKSEEFVPVEIKSEQLQNVSASNWQNIHLSFTPKLIQAYQNLNFTYHQVKDWANALGNSFSPQDHEFINYLKNQKNLTPEQTLNNHNLNSLKAEFQEFEQNQQNSEQQSQTVQQTTPNWQNN